MSGRDKRRYVRVGTRIAVVYSLEGDEGGVARRGIMDSLSLGGALITCEERLTPGDVLTVRIPITSMADSVTADAVVLRTQSGDQPEEYISALEFRELPFEVARRISSLVDEQLVQVLSTFDSLVEHLELMREFARTAVVATELRSVLEALVDTSLRATGAQAGSLMLVDETGEWLTFAVARGPKADDLSKFRLRVGDGIAGLVVRYGRTLNVPDPSQDARWRGDIASAIRYETRGILAVPFALGGRVAGVVQVLNKAGGGRFSSEDARLLEALSSQAAVVVQNLRLWSALKGGAPEYPHLPLAPAAQIEVKASSGPTPAMLAVGDSAVAVCMSLELPVVFNDAAADLLELLDPSGASAAEIDKRLKMALSYGGRIPLDGPSRLVPVVGGGSIRLEPSPLCDRDGQQIGLMALLHPEEPDEPGGPWKG